MKNFEMAHLNIKESSSWPQPWRTWLKILELLLKIKLFLQLFDNQLTSCEHAYYGVSFTTKALEVGIWRTMIRGIWGFSYRSLVSELVLNIHMYLSNNAPPHPYPVNLELPETLQLTGADRISKVCHFGFIFNCKRYGKEWKESGSVDS